MVFENGRGERIYPKCLCHDGSTQIYRFETHSWCEDALNVFLALYKPRPSFCPPHPLTTSDFQGLNILDHIQAPS